MRELQKLQSEAMQADQGQNQDQNTFDRQRDTVINLAHRQITRAMSFPNNHTKAVSELSVLLEYLLLAKTRSHSLSTSNSFVVKGRSIPNTDKDIEECGIIFPKNSVFDGYSLSNFTLFGDKSLF